jgi:hypothetical protein
MINFRADIGFILLLNFFGKVSIGDEVFVKYLEDYPDQKCRLEYVPDEATPLEKCPKH